MKGVIYSKHWEGCLTKLGSLKGEAHEYIFLFGLEAEDWLERLNGQEIDCANVHGIDVFDLQKYGAIVNLPEKFTAMECFWIMNQLLTKETTLEECMKILRGSFSTPIILRYNRDKSELIEKIERELKVWQQE